MRISVNKMRKRAIKVKIKRRVTKINNKTVNSKIVNLDKDQDKNQPNTNVIKLNINSNTNHQSNTKSKNKNLPLDNYIMISIYKSSNSSIKTNKS